MNSIGKGIEMNIIIISLFRDRLVDLNQSWIKDSTNISYHFQVQIGL